MKLKSLITFKNQNLLDTALTHRSYLNEHKDISEHNERLEYLGDAVLELSVSEYIYHKFPEKPEGELTALRSALVRTGTLATISKDLNLGEHLKLSKGEDASDGRNNQAILANTFEAVIGALYLDQGFKTTTKFLRKQLFPLIEEIIDKKLYKDFKSTLQEIIQARGDNTPEYRVLDEIGPDHKKEFTVAVYAGDKELATGSGKSKQTAQQQAAQHALEKISSD